MKVQFQSQIFKTKKEFESWVQTRVYGLPHGFTNKEDTEFLHALLRRHPSYQQKTKYGVSGFFVRLPIKGGPALFVRGELGVLTGFSWRKCIHGAEYSYLSRMSKLLRRSISGQIATFAMRAYPECAHCGEQHGPMEVDHHEPTFAVLRDAFLESRGMEEADINENGALSFEVHKDWQEFHAQNCSLRILCRDCNQNIGAPK